MTDEHAAAIIRRSVKELETHPRMQGKSFGANSALELLVQLSRYLEGREVRWPKPEQAEGVEGSEA